MVATIYGSPSTSAILGFFKFVTIAALWLALGSHSLATEPEVPAVPSVFQDDANLYDVCFVDSQTGWAVGDRGTIWHTKDGGVSWSSQTSTVTCRLESVHFLDTQRGWAVGGSTALYTHRPIGVVLRTEDGGAHWKRQADELLPWLKGVFFRDRQNGYAYGWPSTMFSSGLFQSNDGGVHWMPVSGHSSGWVRAEFDRRANGVFVERTGKLAYLVGGELRAMGTIAGESRHPICVHPSEEGDWILCGNQGLIAQSVDRGQTWTAPECPPSDQLQEFDWQTITRRGSHIWIAGVPGTRILHSQDAGKSFTFYKTPQRLPLYGIAFSDDQHGWAVGAMGTILHTADGGQTWQSQRAAERRLAAMGVFPRSQSIPWEMVAQLGSGDGHRIGLEVLAPSSSQQVGLGTLPFATRLHEATVLAGGVGANLIEGVPLPEPILAWTEAQIRRQWLDQNVAHMDEQLTEYLVRQIRTWQPEMLISLEDASASQEGDLDGWNAMVQSLVTRAAEDAASERPMLKTMESVGLSPWRVPRVTTITRESTRGGYSITGQRVLLTIGQSVSSQADRARALLDSNYQLGQAQWTLRGLSRTGHAEQETNARLNGLISSQDSVMEATRRRMDSLGNTPGDTLGERLRQQNQQIQQRRHIESLLRSKAASDPAASSQMMHLVAELDDEIRGDILFNMGTYLLSVGQSEQAFACWEPFLDTLAKHRLGEAARLKSFWFLASQEGTLHWRLLAHQTAQSVAKATALQVEDGEVRAVTVDTLDPPETASGDASSFGGQQAVLNDEAQDPEIGRRTKQIRKLVDFMQSRQTDLFFEPEVGFPLAAFQRRSKQDTAATKFWKNQLSGRTSAAYRSWASSELALLGQSSAQTRSVWICSTTKQRPRLDGVIDEDAAWSGVVPQRLRSTSGDSPNGTAEVWLAHDDQYLYLAARCPVVQPYTESDPSAVRQRDQKLDADRIEWFIDIDRDAMTYWQLSIDHRGWARESLLQDASWNPTWHIARHSSDSHWIIEAAIELKELSQEPIARSTAWGLGVQRVVPGENFETWMQPAPVANRPEEFGLLIFE